MEIVFNDSIIPVEAAGQLQTWSEDHQLSESLRLRPAPGHTPGSSVLWLEAGSPSVFVGDLTHSPLQLIRPDDPCAFDLDYRAATASRKRVSPRRRACAPSCCPRTIRAMVAPPSSPCRRIHGRGLAGAVHDLRPGPTFGRATGVVTDALTGPQWGLWVVMPISPENHKSGASVSASDARSAPDTSRHPSSDADRELFDGREMAMVHDLLRREFGLLPGVVASITPDG